MDFNEQRDIYIDPFNGQEDIKNKILRHTSDAFREDPLRVLRLARLQAKLGSDWQIANETKKLVIQMKDELQHLQPQRVYKEIKKVLQYKEWFSFFKCLDLLDLLDIIFPTIAELFKKEEMYKIQVLSKKTDDQLVIIVLLYFYTKSPIEIEFPKKTIQLTKLLIQRVDESFDFKSLDMKGKIEFFTSFKRNNELFFQYLQLVHLFQLDISKLDFVKIFEAISSYSPKEWIDNQKNTPAPHEIQEHLQLIYGEYLSKV